MSDPPVLAGGRVKAVIFDIIYTLLHNTSQMMHYELLAAKLGVTPAQLHSVLDRLDSDFELGRITPLDRMWLLAKSLGLTRNEREILDLCDVEMQAAASSWRFYPGVPELLSALTDAGIKVGLCSNLNPVGLFIVGSLNLTQLVTQGVGAAVLSCQVGFMKPNPRIYLEVCKRLGVWPDECLFVDDGGRHRPLEGAQALGMKTAAVLHTDGYAFSHPRTKGVRQADLRLERVALVAQPFGIPRL